MTPLWLYPAFLYGAAAAVVPIALHLLQRKRRAVPLPTIRFLAAAARSRVAVRRWLVLVLRCAVVGLLAAAFARPFSEAYLADRRATVVVLDNSFSLRVAGRWDQLRKWARQELEHTGPNEAIGVLAMNPAPNWVVPLGSEPAMALRALDAFEPGWEATHIDPAVRLAGDVLAAYPSPTRRILLVTDHQRTGWIGTSFDQPLPPGVDLQASPLLPAPRNQAFVAEAGVTRGADGRLIVEVTLGVTNGGPRVVRVFGEAAVTPIFEHRFDFRAGERRRETLALGNVDVGRWVRIELEPDDLAADNVAYALTPPAGTTTPLLVDANTAGYDYLLPALVAASSVAPFARPQLAPAGGWASRSAVMLRSAESFEGANADRLDQFAAAGGSVLVFVDARIAASAWWKRHGLDLVALPTNATPATVRDWVLPHAFVAGVGASGLRDLVGWRFQRGWSLPPTLDPVAYWSDGGLAIGELRVGRGRLLICGFSADRRDGDWPISVAFVPFVHRAARYLLQSLEELPPEHAARVSEPVTLPPGMGLWRCVAGPAIGLPVREVSGIVTPSAPGVYAFEAGERTTLWAVNVAAEEGDLTTWPDGEPWRNLVNRAPPVRSEPAVERVKLASADAEQKTGWWAWCLTAAGLLALLELAVANRTAR